MKNTFEKKYKKLYKAYIKAIKKSTLNPLDHFVLQLKLLRDRSLLMEELIVDGQENLKVATLALAVAEYEAYKSCINRYYDTSNNNIIQLDSSKSKEDVRQAYEAELAYHWTYFWELLKLNLEGWLNYA
jgi:hypothetical protein